MIELKKFPSSQNTFPCWKPRAYRLKRFSPETEVSPFSSMSFVWSILSPGAIHQFDETTQRKQDWDFSQNKMRIKAFIPASLWSSQEVPAVSDGPCLPHPCTDTHTLYSTACPWITALQYNISFLWMSLAAKQGSKRNLKAMRNQQTRANAISGLAWELVFAKLWL